MVFKDPKATIVLFQSNASHPPPNMCIHMCPERHESPSFTCYLGGEYNIYKIGNY